MTTDNAAVKRRGGPRWAPLKILSGLLVLTRNLIDAHADERIGVLFGPSGYGKTRATEYVKNKTQARVIQAKDYWDRRTLLTAILTECSVTDHRGSIAMLAERATMALGEEPNRPLIIDEAGFVVARHMIETLRGIHDDAKMPLVLVGEEGLPDQLKLTERVDGRILERLPAMACDAEDTRKLADFYAPDILITEGLIQLICDRTFGRARRIKNTLHEMQNWARIHGVRSLDEESYTGGYSTDAVPRRSLPEAGIEPGGRRRA